MQEVYEGQDAPSTPTSSVQADAEAGTDTGIYLQRNMVGFVAAIAMALGFFMPWIRVMGLGVTGVNLGEFGDEGVFAWAVLIGAAIAILLYVTRKANRVVNVVVGVVPWLLLGYYAVEAEIGEEIFEVLALGAYLTLIAGAVLAFAPIRPQRTTD